MIRVRGLGHVVLRVRTIQLAEMLRFYMDILGCPVENVHEELGLYQLRAGGNLLDFVLVEGKLGRAKDRLKHVDHYSLQVDSFDAVNVRRDLIKAGVRVGDHKLRYDTDGHAWTLNIYDPEGNVIELMGPSSNITVL
ncbi:Glyoxalase/bleomycin resistance protein/ring-cleaving dioxygenase [Thraustotheca clavata]|uniref:Glyoxalase/bleomycin resistance protein/ring-cleaving dioxygenase n=1 Tax=Thraustotheca clavata TaxID=74557 RepID=A0A1V9YUU4_9STRA|nr:Glyoxalase/bleomycin resistance protein/ring-cleaving dioxygenase [Thraustotheca clavata]